MARSLHLYRTPHSRLTTLEVPSKTMLLVPVGSQHLVSLPNTTTIKTNAQARLDDHVLMVPAGSKVTAPAYTGEGRAKTFMMYLPFGSRLQVPRGMISWLAFGARLTYVVQVYWNLYASCVSHGDILFRRLNYEKLEGCVGVGSEACCRPSDYSRLC